MLPNPLSRHAYKRPKDGPSLCLGFMGVLFDDGTQYVFEHSSGGATKAVSALATATNHAIVAFNELVHPVIALDSYSYENSSSKKIYNPRFNIVGFVTDKRVKEVDSLSEEDILAKPAKAKVKLASEEDVLPPPPIPSATKTRRSKGEKADL